MNCAIVFCRILTAGGKRPIMPAMRYETPHIQRLVAYTPGEQPVDAAVIKLNTNENPYPPSPAVLDAIMTTTADQLRRYPSPTAAPLRSAAAALHDLPADQIIATNGGDELLRLAVACFASEGRPIGTVDPSYSLYPVLADTADVPTVTVDLPDDCSLPTDLAAQWNTANVGLGFIVNPHAPSGRLYELDQLRTIAKELKGVLLIDEAYVNFTDTDCLDLIRADSGLDNVLILRSMSKGYGLAGLRLGYGIGPASLISILHKVRDSYNIDVLAQRAGAAALTDQAYARSTWQRVIDERRNLTDALRSRGFAVGESHTNFVLTTPPQEASARSLYESLKARNIFVRWFNHPMLEDKLRISIGTPQQDAALLTAIDELL